MALPTRGDAPQHKVLGVCASPHRDNEADSRGPRALHFLSTMTTDRLPPIPTEQWSAAQHREAQPIIDGPRGALVSPFIPLLRSPELMGHAQRMGEYLRYRSALNQRLSELAILVTARCWSQQVEWAIHAPIALKAGVAPSTVEAIAQGRKPEPLPADEAAVYAFSIELQQDKSVSDATWGTGHRALWRAGRDRSDRHQRLLQPAVHGDECKPHTPAGLERCATAAAGASRGLWHLWHPWCLRPSRLLPLDARPRFERACPT